MTPHENNVPNPPFAFSPGNEKKIQEILSHYPEDKRASGVIPLLDLAQRQNNGWLSRAAIEAVAARLSVPFMRVYEVATFYTMFNLTPVGKFLIQVCTTTPCMLCGSDNLMAVCQDYLGIRHGETTEDGLFTVTEVECLGACANAPMVQINDDYFEDLNEASFKKLLDRLKAGETIAPCSLTGRRSSEPQKGGRGGNHAG